MSENAAAEATEAELLAAWFIERTDHFDPVMLAGMTRGACGAPYAIESGPNHEFVTLPRDVFIRLLKASRQEHSLPENYQTREP